jgi:hypothetical protein
VTLRRRFTAGVAGRQELDVIRRLLARWQLFR